jgi:hypothetical protein
MGKNGDEKLNKAKILQVITVMIALLLLTSFYQEYP